MKKKDILKIFEAHGVEFTGESGNQMFGFCPFSGKDNKFYVNKKNGLWDSKTAGLSGNVSKFLELTAERYAEQLKGQYVKTLAENRQMSRRAFEGVGMGWDGKAFTFPVRDYDGHVQDIRRYLVRAKLMLSTSGCKAGLFGANRLKEKPMDTVYLCEGEWDAMALRWLLKLNSEPGVVVSVPGAYTFKKEWLPWLRDRDVVLMYDADNPGRQGEEKAMKRLTGVAKKLRYVHWPDEVPDGFDTRDWIKYGVTLRDTPDICWERLQRRFHDKPKWMMEPRTLQVVLKKGKIVLKKGQRRENITRWKTAPTLADVHATFNKWLCLKNTHAIDVVLATVISQRIDGSPVWMFLVGPPGSAKTAIVSSLQGTDGVYATSTLTAPSLISGASFSNGGSDPSLIPRLNGKVLVVKDFSAILSQPDRDQKEIFGILRDAYDGRCGKIFGNGVERNYESRFTVLGATIPQIYNLSEQHAALGERFLKFMVGDNLHHESEAEVIRKAIENADRETAMHDEVQDVVKQFLERTAITYKPPTVPSKILEKIVALAKFGARMRGSVSRDFYRNDIVTSRPMAEVGTRLGQQLAKLGRGLAMIQNKKEVGEEEYQLVKKVVVDTISQRNEDVLRAMIGAMGGSEVLTPMSLRDIATKTHYPFATIQRLAQDLAALQIIKRQGAGAISTWTLSDYVKREVQAAQLYTQAEVTAEPSGRIRLVRRRKQKFRRTIRVPLGQVQVSSNNGSGKITITTPPQQKEKDDAKDSKANLTQNDSTSQGDIRVRTPSS